ncbi:MAG: hypothetical protein WBE76_11775, partial [Terracidiphilus sp.]
APTLKSFIFSWALQVAEKLEPEGGGGFNPRIKPAESKGLQPRKETFHRFHAKCRVFPQPV